jgi:ribosomal protein S18 acetylase RimI-like enzyme
VSIDWIARLARPESALSVRERRDGDLPFLQALYASTRADELAQVPWSELEKQTFLARQFEAQHAHYRDTLPDAHWLMLELDGARAGRIYLDDREDEVRLVDMALLPEHRNLGLGTHLLTTVIDGARETGRTVRLHVERHNPAWRLYARHGFVELEDRGVYRFLEWQGEGRD